MSIQISSNGLNFNVDIPPDPGGTFKYNNHGTYSTFKNRIINGDMEIDQRFGGYPCSIPGGYTGSYAMYGAMDRWISYTGGGTSPAANVQQSYYTYSGYNFTKAITITQTNNPNTFTSAIGLAQRIESKNIQDLVGQTVTLSGWFQTTQSSNAVSGTTFIEYNIWTPNSKDGWSSPGNNTLWYNTTNILTGKWAVFVNNPTPAFKSVSFTLPAGAAYGLMIDFSMKTVYPNGQGDNFTMTGIQLERGPVASSFDFIPRSKSLELCQNYCYALASVRDSATTYGTQLPGTMFQTGYNGTSTPYIYYIQPTWKICFPTQMRSTPNVFGNYDSTGNTSIQMSWSNGSTGGSYYSFVSQMNMAISSNRGAEVNCPTYYGFWASGGQNYNFPATQINFGTVYNNNPYYRSIYFMCEL